MIYLSSCYCCSFEPSFNSIGWKHIFLLYYCTIVSMFICHCVYCVIVKIIHLIILCVPRTLSTFSNRKNLCHWWLQYYTDFHFINQRQIHYLHCLQMCLLNLQAICITAEYYHHLLYIIVHC